MSASLFKYHIPAGFKRVWVKPLKFKIAL